MEDLKSPHDALVLAALACVVAQAGLRLPFLDHSRRKNEHLLWWWVGSNSMLRCLLNMHVVDVTKPFTSISRICDVEHAVTFSGGATHARLP